MNARRHVCARTDGCPYACVNVWHACMHVCMRVYARVCIYACMHAHIHVRMCVVTMCVCAGIPAHICMEFFYNYVCVLVM